MATVKDVMDRAARAVRVQPPTNWIGSTTTTAMELKDLLGEVVSDIQQRLELPSPFTAQQTIAGDGSATYSLASSFKRLVRDMPLFETGPVRRYCSRIARDNDWSNLQELGTGAGERYYRVYGTDVTGWTVEFYPALETDGEVLVNHVTNVWMRSAAGVNGSAWAAADDYLLLDGDLVVAGIKWRWRRAKGFDHASALAEYEAICTRYQNDSRGIRKIDMTGGPAERPGHFMSVPVPDYIPSS